MLDHSDVFASHSSTSRGFVDGPGKTGTRNDPIMCIAIARNVIPDHSYVLGNRQFGMGPGVGSREVRDHAIGRRSTGHHFNHASIRHSVRQHGMGKRLLRSWANIVVVGRGLHFFLPEFAEDASMRQQTRAPVHYERRSVGVCSYFNRFSQEKVQGREGRAVQTDLPHQICVGHMDRVSRKCLRISIDRTVGPICGYWNNL